MTDIKIKNMLTDIRPVPYEHRFIKISHMKLSNLVGKAEAIIRYRDCIITFLKFRHNL